MAARNRKGLSENTRERIKTTMIVKRLEDHIDGRCELSTTQIQAARILLDRTLPSMSQVEHTGEVEHHYVMRSPEPAKTADEWAQQHRLQ